MRTLVSAVTASLALTVACLSVPAHAQATRTWVSGVGDDANPCSRTAPCKTFAGAISKTATGGIINCLDPGGFGAVTITKAISIRCVGTGTSGILASGTNGVNINAAGAIVRIEDVAIEGAPGSGLTGVNVIAVGALHLRNVLISQFSSNGVAFAPSTGATQLFITDSTIADNGGASGSGVNIAPTGTASVAFAMNNVSLLNNKFGLRAAANLTSGPVTGGFTGGSVSGNSATGILAVTAAGQGAVTVIADGTNFSNNREGAQANGDPTAQIYVGRSTLTGNQTALKLGGGQVFTYGTNQMNGNVSDGTLTSASQK